MTLGNFICYVVVFLVGWAVGEMIAGLKQPRLDTDELCDVMDRIAEHCDGNYEAQRVMIDEVHKYMEEKTELAVMSKPLFDIINAVTNYGE